MTTLTPKKALEEAVSVMGGQTALAAACGPLVKQQHVWNWLNRSGRLPDQYALKVAAATKRKGREIPAEQLCPEMFDGISGDTAA